MGSGGRLCAMRVAHGARIWSVCVGGGAGGNGVVRLCGMLVAHVGCMLVRDVATVVTWGADGHCGYVGSGWTLCGT